MELNRFLELPRYYAKLPSPSKFEILEALLNNIKFLLLKPFIKPFAKELIRSIYKIIFNGLSDNVLFCLFDIYSTIIFLIYKNLYNPDCSLISTCHHQHSNG